MQKKTSNFARSLKTSITSILIVGACGAVAYNMLVSQEMHQNRPGSTAVRVQVKDIDSERRDEPVAPSTIGHLLNKQQLAAPTPQSLVLTMEIQRQLADLGYYSGEIDGRSGPQTFAAVKNYQRQNALAVSGDVSQKLLEHIKFTRKIAEAGNITGSIPPQTKAGHSVQEIQQRLKVFGYEPGPADGIAGSATIAAIRKFEQDRSLPVTGKISQRLVRELGL